MAKRIKLEGLKFNRWSVIDYAYNHQNHSFYLCVCDCGEKKLVSGNYLRTGRSKSCGCYNKEVHEERLKKTRIKAEHWFSLRNIHHAMHQRCAIQKNYLEKQIIVCQEWQKFKPFYEWAMANGYKPGLHIDRRNNFGSYTPDNCRFVTPLENARNTTKNVWHEINNTKYISSELPKIIKKSQSWIDKKRKSGMTAQQIYDLVNT